MLYNIVVVDVSSCIIASRRDEMGNLFPNLFSANIIINVFNH